MRNLTLLLTGLAVAGSGLAGGTAGADERGDRRRVENDDKKAPVEVVRDHRDEPVRRDVRDTRDVREERPGARDERPGARDERRDGRPQSEPVKERGERVVRAPVAAPPRAPADRGGRISGYVWIPGEYRFLEGQYVYIPGHHERERPGQHWVAGSWSRHGKQFVQVPGRWVR
jgi:hypothetical protein